MNRQTLTVAVCAAPTVVLAQQSDPAAVTRGLTPFIVAALIAYATRKMAIGGWLFYFYLAIFGNALLTFTLAYSHIGDYFTPSLWYDAKTYWLGALSYLPWLASFIAVLVSAVRLMFPSQRNKDNAMLLRYSFLALVATAVLGFIVDIVYFPDNSLLSAISTIAASIMCVYFFFSRRVKYVFDNWSGRWNYEEFARGSPLSRKE